MEVANSNTIRTRTASTKKADRHYLRVRCSIASSALFNAHTNNNRGNNHNVDYCNSEPQQLPAGAKKSNSEKPRRSECAKRRNWKRRRRRRRRQWTSVRTTSIIVLVVGGCFCVWFVYYYYYKLIIQREESRTRIITTNRRNNETSKWRESPSEPQQQHDHHHHDKNKPLTVYVQQKSSANNGGLQKRVLLEEKDESSGGFNCHQPYLHLPIDDTNDDPYLPWLHDYFVVTDDQKDDKQDDHHVDENSVHVQFIAQNKRRCDTGHNKQTIMKYWEPQMALFQPVSVVLEEKQAKEEKDGENTHSYRLVDTSTEIATYNETRFICRFHDNNNNESKIVFSEYNVNYEYLNWRKRGNQNKPMFEKVGPDVKIFDYSTLLFSCQIPNDYMLRDAGLHSLWVDLIPIRTPARYDDGYMLTEQHVGPKEYRHLHQFRYNNLSTSLRLPSSLDGMGRIENLPICRPKTKTTKEKKEPEKTNHRLVACTWAAATYHRRGKKNDDDGRRVLVNDAPQRLQEWLVFHHLVGFDHAYVYDNTFLQHDNDDNASPLKVVADRFPSDFVTYIRWPAPVCSNNFIGGRNPGERSSQYAAESSCRERFGKDTEWMAVMDIDEYLVPMHPSGHWGPVLDQKMGPVLGMKSVRAKPRVELMEEVTTSGNDPDRVCPSTTKEKLDDGTSPTTSSCLVPKQNETYLHVYNCDDVRPPRPFRYFTNMKQIFKPKSVLSHFVHYTIATTTLAEYYYQKDDAAQRSFSRRPSNSEKGLTFLDEATEGAMIHARTVFPHETIGRDTSCKLQAKGTCPVGMVCPASTPYKDKLLDKNIFTDEQGHYCNCWLNELVEHQLVPRLEQALRDIG